MHVYDTRADIQLSQRENRTVTLYPDTAAEQTAIHVALLAECEDSQEERGTGYSGPEARGWTRYWGATWQIDVVNAAAESV